MLQPWCLLLLALVLINGQDPYMPTLYPKFFNQSLQGLSFTGPIQNNQPSLMSPTDVLLAINQVKGSECCNECLFMPDLQPCAYFIAPVTFSTYFGANPGNPNPPNNGQFPWFFKPFVQLDDNVMCFDTGGPTPSPNFNIFFLNPALLVGSPAKMDFAHSINSGYSFWFDRQCSMDVKLEKKTGIDTYYPIGNEILCGPGDGGTDDRTVYCICQPGGDTMLGYPPYTAFCASDSAILASVSHSYKQTQYNQTQFISTQFWSYTASDTFWISFYRGPGSLSPGLMLDFGNGNGQPSTTDPTARYVPSATILTETQAPSTCGTPADDMSWLCVTTRGGFLSSETAPCPLTYVSTAVPPPGATSCAEGNKGDAGKDCSSQVVVDKAVWLAQALPLNNYQSLGVWCDAPANPKSTVCTGTEPGRDATGSLYLSLKQGGFPGTRGCVGYGFCPTNSKGIPCSGIGTCMNNARCSCPAGFGGQACDQQLSPSLTLTNCSSSNQCGNGSVCQDTFLGPFCQCPTIFPESCQYVAPLSYPYTCAQFDPCSGNGQCIDTFMGPACLCNDGFRGSLLNGVTPFVNGEINMYNHAFFCGSSQCAGWQAAFEYMRHHQCLFFVDNAGGVGHFARRYLRMTSVTADNVPVDMRLSTAVFPFSLQPLWYSGPADFQLFSTNPATYGAPVTTQVVVRGFNCIDGRTLSPSLQTLMLPPEDLPNGVLRGGPSCLPCPPCVTNQSVCVEPTEICGVTILNTAALSPYLVASGAKVCYARYSTSDGVVAAATLVAQSGCESLPMIHPDDLLIWAKCMYAYMQTLPPYILQFVDASLAPWANPTMPAGLFETGGACVQWLVTYPCYRDYNLTSSCTCQTIAPPSAIPTIDPISLPTALQCYLQVRLGYSCNYETCPLMKSTIETYRYDAGIQWQQKCPFSGAVADMPSLARCWAVQFFYYLETVPGLATATYYQTGHILTDNQIPFPDPIPIFESGMCPGLARFQVNPGTTLRECQCYPNYGNSDPNNRICDMAVCPWVAGQASPCGAPSAGQCNNVGGNTSSGYVGYCSCYKGYTGAACEVQSCPTAQGTGLMCNGFAPNTVGTNPNDTSSADTPPAVDCISATGQCVCNLPYYQWNPVTRVCDLVGCALDSSGMECHGLAIYGTVPASASVDPNNTLNSVCSRIRNPSTNLGTCQCYEARNPNSLTSHQSAVSFFGTACTEPYNTSGACTDPTTGMYCGGLPAASCYVNNPGANPTSAPSCFCPPNAQGQFCQMSPCNPQMQAAYACSANVSQPTGVCEGYTPCALGGSSCFSTSCTTSSSNCQWECRCYFIDPDNHYLPCDVAGPGFSTSPTCVYFSQTNPWTQTTSPGTPCLFPLTNCSFYDTSMSIPAWTVCGQAGVAACMPTETGDELFCNCTGSGYTGQYCQTQQACGGACPYPNGVCNAHSQCTCSSYYTGNTTSCSSTYPCCSVSACQNPGEFNVSTGVCTCPADSNFVYPGSQASVFPYCYSGTDSASYKGCAWACPTYHGMECGGCMGIRKSVNGYSSRCSSRTIPATSAYSLPTCNCSVLGADLSTTSSAFIPWTTGTNGACEPYCVVPGGVLNPAVQLPLVWNESATYNAPVCICTSGFSGPRCNESSVQCENGGIANLNVVPPTCACSAHNPDFPYTSASDCTVPTCDPAISTYNASLNPNQCTCLPPYSYASPSAITCSNLCQNGALPNISTGVCTCSEPYYGILCNETDCTNPNPVPWTCTCEQPGYYYSISENQCVMPACEQGVWNATAGQCECFPMWTGQNCEQDLCAVYPSDGIAMLNTSGNASNNSYYCFCDQGWATDVFGLCTLSACGYGGILTGCNVSVLGLPLCPYENFTYQCLCGDGFFGFSNSTLVQVWGYPQFVNQPTCIPPDCGPNGKLLVINNLFTCACHAGYYTNASGFCEEYLCQGNTTYNPVSGDCECPLPYSNPPECTNYTALCGPGSTDPLANSTACSCLEGYMLANPPMISDNGVNPCVLNCSGGSYQLATTNSCVCFVGYEGPFCETYLNLNSSTLCGPGSIPLLGSSPYCFCQTGYIIPDPPQVNQYGVNPCVVNCSFPGTQQATITGCVCQFGFEGDLCSEITPQSYSSGPTLPVYAWVLIAIAIVAAIVGFSVLGWYEAKKHRTTTKDALKPDKKKLLRRR